MDNKKTLVSKQIFIMLYLVAAAISAMEASIQFQDRGFKNWRVYFFGGIFLFSAAMYFIRRKQRFESKQKND
jgi:hypothetical protein